jgi:hypothetical protein
VVIKAADELPEAEEVVEEEETGAGVDTDKELEITVPMDKVQSLVCVTTIRISLIPLIALFCTLIFQGDGSFGSAYVQDDEVEFKEETQANGDRMGQYSYIDPTGKKITVQYTTGKNGLDGSEWRSSSKSSSSSSGSSNSSSTTKQFCSSVQFQTN